MNFAQLLKGHVQHGTQEYPECGRDQHAAEHRRADAALAGLASAAGDHQGTSPRMNAKLVISTARIRSRAPLVAASRMDLPPARWAIAN